MTTDLAVAERPGAGELTRAHEEAPSQSQLVAVERDIYAGIAATRVTEKQAEILTAPCDTNDLDVLPTGELYLSQVGYRRRLKAAFGPAGWAMRKLGKPTLSGATLMQEWALYAEGRFISEAWGEADYQERNSRHSYATAAEALKSNALMRCCKDLLIASECWDRRFTAQFKKDHCVKVWRTKAKSGKGEYQWRRKDSEKFYDERGGKGQPDEPPDGVDTETGEDHSQAPADAKPKSNGGAFINGKQQGELIKAGTSNGWSPEQLAKWITEQYGAWNKVPEIDYAAVLTRMQNGPKGGVD